MGPIAQAHPTAQIPGQKRLEAGAPGSASAPRPPPPTPPSCPTQPTRPCLLSPPWAWPVPLSARSISCPQSLFPTGLTLSLSPAASPPFSVHICFSLMSLHGPPRPPFSLPPRLPLPFHLPLPWALPTEVAGSRGRNFKRRSKLGSPIKDQTLQERTTPPHRL